MSNHEIEKKPERTFTKFDKFPKFKNEDLVESSFINASDRKTESCTIKIAGSYFGKPLSRGNIKVDKNTGLFSLFAGATCLNCKDCIGNCYACREQRYTNVYNKRVAYTHLATANTNYLASVLDTQIKHEKNHGMKYVRIHESGDFFNNDYIDMWNDIIKRHSDIRFYYFTKVEDILDFSPLKLNNVNSVKSVLPDGSINFGSEDYILEKSKKFNIPICPYSRDLNNGCGKCTICAFSPYVLIKEH